MMVQCLIEIYQGNEFLQEPIAAVFAKLCGVLRVEHKQVGLQALEIIMEQLVVGKGEIVDFKKKILSESNRLSLYLTLKKAYRQGGYSGMSKEYEDLFTYNLLTDKHNLPPL